MAIFARFAYNGAVAIEEPFVQDADGDNFEIDASRPVVVRAYLVGALVSAVIVVVFGGATLIFQNETFIKLKPTIIYLLFAGTLFGGLIFRKPLLAMVFDQMFHLSEEGWRKLTIRWALFFVALAVLNEIVWRTQSTDTWVAFKVFGVMPLTFIFAALQYPLLTKYDANPEKK